MVKILQGDGKAIFTVFVGAIIAIVFLASIADSVFVQTNTFTVTNETVTAPATNNSLALTGRELVSGTTPITTNSSNGTSANLQLEGVIVETTIINGIETVALRINQTGDSFAGTPINVTYDFQPGGYLSSSSDRAIAALIVIFGALGALIFVLIVFIKDGTLGRFMRSK